MSGRDLISYNPGPVTVQPEEESVLGLTPLLTLYQYGPIGISPKGIFANKISVRHHGNNAAEKNETESNITSAMVFT